MVCNKKRKPVFMKRKWNHVVFSRATILSFHSVSQPADVSRPAAVDQFQQLNTSKSSDPQPSILVSQPFNVFILAAVESCNSTCWRLQTRSHRFSYFSPLTSPDNQLPILASPLADLSSATVVDQFKQFIPLTSSDLQSLIFVSPPPHRWCFRLAASDSCISTCWRL